jgi:hypothetical protein
MNTSEGSTLATPAMKKLIKPMGGVSPAILPRKTRTMTTVSGSKPRAVKRGTMRGMVIISIAKSSITDPRKR